MIFDQFKKGEVALNFGDLALHYLSNFYTKIENFLIDQRISIVRKISNIIDKASEEHQQALRVLQKLEFLSRFIYDNKNHPSK